MSVGFWNVRGGRRKNLFVEIKSFCVANHIDIMVICETKSYIAPTNAVVKKCGFMNFDFFFPLLRDRVVYG